MSIDVTKETIEEALSSCFSLYNRDSFLSLIGRMPNISVYNILLVFMQNKRARYVAGAGEWVKAGIKIKGECKGQEITVLLPSLKKSGDTAFTLSYVPFFVYDVTQTAPDPLFYKPDISNIAEKYRELTGNSVEYTKDIRILEGYPSCLVKSSDERTILYVKTLTDEIKDSEVLREYVKSFAKTLEISNDMIINAATYAALSLYFDTCAYGFSLSFLDEVEKLNSSDKISFIESVMSLTFRVISSISGKTYLGIDKIVILRELSSFILKYVNSGKEDAKKGRELLCQCISDVKVSANNPEYAANFTKELTELKDFILRLDTDSFNSFSNQLLTGNLTIYPKTEYNFAEIQKKGGSYEQKQKEQA